MRSLRLFLSAFILASTALTLHAAEPSDAGQANQEQLLAEIRNKPDARITEEPMLLRIEVPSESSIYLFTRQGHMAHPSVIIRREEADGGGRFTKTSGYTSGDPTIFEQWLRQVEAQQAELPQRINR